MAMVDKVDLEGRSWADEMEAEDARATKEDRVPVLMKTRGSGYQQQAVAVPDKAQTVQAAPGQQQQQVQHAPPQKMWQVAVDAATDHQQYPQQYPQVEAYPQAEGCHTRGGTPEDTRKVRRTGQARRAAAAAARRGRRTASFGPSSAMPPHTDMSHVTSVAHVSGLMAALPISAAIPAATTAPLPLAAPAAPPGGGAPRGAAGAHGWEHPAAAAAPPPSPPATAAPPPLCVARLLQQSAQQYGGCGDAVAAAEHRAAAVTALRAVLPGYTVTRYGSERQGTALATSDVDVAVAAPGGAAERAAEVVDAVVAAVVNRGDGAGLHVAEEVLGARRPLARLRYAAAGGGARVDVSAEGPRTGRCDDAIRALLDGAPCVRDFVCVVKAWARARGVCDAACGLPSATMWVVVALAHAQLLGLLPLLPVAGAAAPPPAAAAHPRDAAPLLRSFFDWVLQSDLASCTISLAHGQALPRCEAHSSATLSVADPSDPANNLARATTPDGWECVVRELHRASSLVAQCFFGELLMPCNAPCPMAAPPPTFPPCPTPLPPAGPFAPPPPTPPMGPLAAWGEGCVDPGSLPPFPHFAAQPLPGPGACAWVAVPPPPPLQRWLLDHVFIRVPFLCTKWDIRAALGRSAGIVVPLWEDAGSETPQIQMLRSHKKCMHDPVRAAIKHDNGAPATTEAIVHVRHVMPGQDSLVEAVQAALQAHCRGTIPSNCWNAEEYPVTVEMRRKPFLWRRRKPIHALHIHVYYTEEYAAVHSVGGCEDLVHAVFDAGKIEALTGTMRMVATRTDHSKVIGFVIAEFTIQFRTREHAVQCRNELNEKKYPPSNEQSRYLFCADAAFQKDEPTKPQWIEKGALAVGGSELTRKELEEWVKAPAPSAPECRQLLAACCGLR